MKLYRSAELVMGLTDRDWERHSNPASVWTRFLAFPLLTIAFWSRAWIDWWSLIPIAGAFAFLWLNPRLFNAPGASERWETRGVLGERLFMRASSEEIPQHFRNASAVLSVLSLLGAAIWAIGLIELALWPTVFGATLGALSKAWLFDRMAWFYGSQ